MAGALVRDRRDDPSYGLSRCIQDPLREQAERVGWIALWLLGVPTPTGVIRCLLRGGT
jgi:hypothetical protein